MSKTIIINNKESISCVIIVLVHRITSAKPGIFIFKQYIKLSCVLYTMPKRTRNLNKVYTKLENVNNIEEEKEEVVRCEWVNSDPLYIDYHDTEWGQPQFDSVRLFEMLCLEGQQAGLSWITILKKRKHYKLLFHNFNPHEISKFNKNDLDRFICDPGLIRHRGKLEAIINNSKCFLKMKDMGIDFSKFVWNFVDNEPIINKWKSAKEVPTKTEASIALSNALKKQGFKFVGSTICYAFMQACGLVNDHILGCICYNGTKVSSNFL